MPDTPPDDAASRVYRHAFSFKTDHPQSLDAVRAHIGCRPSLLLLKFVSATVYNLPDGTVSRIVAEFESHIRTLVLEVRPADGFSTKAVIDQAKA